MIYTFICRRCDDLPVAACCRVMGVSTSGFYAWRACPVSDRDWNDAVLTNTIVDVQSGQPPLLWLAPGARGAPTGLEHIACIRGPMQPTATMRRGRPSSACLAARTDLGVAPRRQDFRARPAGQ